MKRVAVLGATGSIGANTLSVIARHPQRFRISALTAHKNIESLAALCQQFQPELAVVANPNDEAELRARLAAAGRQIRVLAGRQALIEAATGSHCDTVVAAIVGAAGLESTLAAAQAGKRLLLANKEAIVMAGPLLLEAMERGGGELLPVDSEHNAIFQCLPHGSRDLSHAGVRRIILTASGGPFRGRSRNELSHITPEQACAHPNWSMGRKISVDSATLMNKGLEVIEAHFLFRASPDKIEVLIHPQSIIHSMVEYLDGSVLAQLGNPDMRTAIGYALAWPERIETGVKPLDLVQIAKLEFSAPDRETFPCLELAYAALRKGGTAPALLNAANEEAVDAFLRGELPFLAIPQVIEQVLNKVPVAPITQLEQLFDSDLTARREATCIIKAMSSS